MSAEIGWNKDDLEDLYRETNGQIEDRRPLTTLREDLTEWVKAMVFSEFPLSDQATIDVELCVDHLVKVFGGGQ